jgi:streptomycin 6-kinase
MDIVSGRLPDRWPDHWDVSDPELIAETFSSRIWKVRLTDGSPAVVKALKPFDDVADELRGAHYLSWRDGVGAVRLLGFEGHDMLLEYAGDRLLADELNEHGDRHATDIANEVMTKLFSPSDAPPPADLQPLRQRYPSLFKKAEADRNAGVESLYVEAAVIAERLLSNPHELRVLHGDLHHDNILLGERGWLVIDPKGILGDPGFDAANFFYNPLDRHGDLCVDPAPGRWGSAPTPSWITPSPGAACHRPGIRKTRTMKTRRANSPSWRRSARSGLASDRHVVFEGIRTLRAAPVGRGENQHQQCETLMH